MPSAPSRPKSRWSPPKPAGPKERRSAPASGPASSPGETILLVEDDAQVRLIVANMLETRGYRVLAAGDADAAAEVAAAASTSIDLILSDLEVAGRSGRDIAEAARKLHPHACVLHMSGYTDEAAIRRGVLERGAPFIEKPFSSDDLARHVRDALGGRTPERSAA